jgi:hypothetical protein
MGVSGEMEGKTAPMEHQPAGESSSVVAPEYGPEARPV